MRVSFTRNCITFSHVPFFFARLKNCILSNTVDDHAAMLSIGSLSLPHISLILQEFFCGICFYFLTDNILRSYPIVYLSDHLVSPSLISQCSMPPFRGEEHLLRLCHGNLCIKYGRSRIDRLKKIIVCDNILSGRR